MHHAVVGFRHNSGLLLQGVIKRRLFSNAAALKKKKRGNGICMLFPLARSPPAIRCHAQME